MDRGVGWWGGGSLKGVPGQRESILYSKTTAMTMMNMMI